MVMREILFVLLSGMLTISFVCPTSNFPTSWRDVELNSYRKLPRADRLPGYLKNALLVVEFLDHLIPIEKVPDLHRYTFGAIQDIFSSGDESISNFIESLGIPAVHRHGAIHCWNSTSQTMPTYDIIPEGTQLLLAQNLNENDLDHKLVDEPILIRSESSDEQPALYMQAIEPNRKSMETWANQDFITDQSILHNEVWRSVLVQDACSRYPDSKDPSLSKELSLTLTIIQILRDRIFNTPFWTHVNGLALGVVNFWIHSGEVDWTKTLQSFKIPGKILCKMIHAAIYKHNIRNQAEPASVRAHTHSDEWHNDGKLSGSYCFEQKSVDFDTLYNEVFQIITPISDDMQKIEFCSGRSENRRDRMKKLVPDLPIVISPIKESIPATAEENPQTKLTGKRRRIRKLATLTMPAAEAMYQKDELMNSHRQPEKTLLKSDDGEYLPTSRSALSDLCRLVKKEGVEQIQIDPSRPSQVAIPTLLSRKDLGNTKISKYLALEETGKKAVRLQLESSCYEIDYLSSELQSDVIAKAIGHYTLSSFQRLLGLGLEFWDGFFSSADSPIEKPLRHVLAQTAFKRETRTVATETIVDWERDKIRDAFDFACGNDYLLPAKLQATCNLLKCVSETSSKHLTLKAFGDDTFTQVQEFLDKGYRFCRGIFQARVAYDLNSETENCFLQPTKCAQTD